MTPQERLTWLLSGDVSVQYRVRRELLHETPGQLASLRARIATEGWGKAILEKQRDEGWWGEGYYQPKWISTHYTLLDLMYLGMPPDTPGPKAAVTKTIETFLSDDGALNFAGGGHVSDDCVGAMFLGTACYFGGPSSALNLMADHLLKRRLADGGWNCSRDTPNTVHSSVHTTISCLEGLARFQKTHHGYRSREIKAALGEAEEFLLAHHLCWSHRTGEIMDKRMLMLSWPSRWYFDILRGLEYFADAGRPWDDRLKRALTVLESKRRTDGRWPVQARHPGQTHLEMEKTGEPSRWNTFRALKVLRAYSGGTGD